MEPGNQTRVLEFLLLGFSQDSEKQRILFGLFLSVFVVTVLGNLLIILAISSDPRVHTPMYFFLCNLSLADIGFISTTVPKMIANIQTQSKSISYAGCITQMCLFMVFGGMDTFLLTVMAYDRFVAICHPSALHGHHEPLPLWSAGSCVLVHQLVILPDPESVDVAAVLLYQLGHSTLLL